MAKAKWNVKSYVMFDTETTGLMSPGNKPRITELCFIALTREEILTSQREPRVINKLSLCVNPDNKKIHHQSSEITGLYNDALSYQVTFNEQADLVVSFLQNLPQPVCLIAHNGHGFDFPLLMAELKKCKKELCGGILCADTLEAFRSFDGLPPVPNYVLERERNKKRVMSPPVPNVPSVACIQHNVEKEKDDFLKRPPCKKRGTECIDGIDIRNMKEQKIDTLQQRNERTPDRKPLNFNNQTIHKQSQHSDLPQSDGVRKNLFSMPNFTLRSNIRKEDITKQVHQSNSSQYESSETDLESTGEMKLLSQQSITDSEIDLLEACEEAEQQLPQMTRNQNSEGSKPMPVQNIDVSENESSNSKEKRSYTLGNLYTDCCGQRPEQRNERTPDKKTLNFNNQAIHKQSQHSDLPQNDGVRKNVFPMPKLTLRSKIRKEDITKQVNQSNSSQYGSSETDLKSTGEMKLLSQQSITDSEIDLLEACEEAEQQLPQMTRNQNSEMQHSVGSKPMPVQNIDLKVTVSENKSSNGKETKSYALGNLYTDCFGQRPEVVHTAEADCKILLKLIIFRLKEFIPYCDCNAVLFSNVEPMY